MLYKKVRCAITYSLLLYKEVRCAITYSLLLYILIMISNLALCFIPSYRAETFQRLVVTWHERDWCGQNQAWTYLTGRKQGLWCSCATATWRKHGHTWLQHSHKRIWSGLNGVEMKKTWPIRYSYWKVVKICIFSTFHHISNFPGWQGETARNVERSGIVWHVH